MRDASCGGTGDGDEGIPLHPARKTKGPEKGQKRTGTMATKDKGPREQKMLNSAVRMAEANATRAEQRASKASQEAIVLRAYADGVKASVQTAIEEAQARLG
jgi:hypothetical protein